MEDFNKEMEKSKCRILCAEADAAQRRADAEAAHEEMKALNQEMQARVVAAEALLLGAKTSFIDALTESVKKRNGKGELFSGKEISDMLQSVTDV